MYLESDPGCAETQFTLAGIKEDQGHYPEAISLYRRALELDSREPRHYIRLIRLYEKMRRELLEEAIARYPDSPALKDLLKGGPAQ